MEKLFEICMKTAVLEHEKAIFERFSEEEIMIGSQKSRKWSTWSDFVLIFSILVGPGP